MFPGPEYKITTADRPVHVVNVCGSPRPDSTRRLTGTAKAEAGVRAQGGIQGIE